MASSTLTFDLIAKDRASAAFDKVGKSADKAGDRMRGLKTGAKIAAAGMAVLAVKFGKDSVAAFTEAEQSQVKLQQAFAKFPKLADTSIDKLGDLNEALAQKTKFDDDATASGQAVLAQFGLTGKQIEELTPLLQDYAAKTGKDLPDAATILGKAVLGNGKALKAVGLNLKDTGTATGNLDQLMGGLRTQVGGFATAEGKTAAGQTAIMANRFGELQETIGAKLVPVITRLVGMLASTIDFITRNLNVIGPLIAVLGGLAAVIYTVITAAKIYTAVQTALNIVLTLNPIGIVVVALAALGVALVVAYKKSETFRRIVDGAFGMVVSNGRAMATAIGKAGGAIGAVFGAVTKAASALSSGVAERFGRMRQAAATTVGWVKARFDDMVSFVRGIPGAISSAVSGAFGGLVSAFRNAINTIIDKWNSLQFTLRVPKIHIKGTNQDIGGGSATVGVPQIPRFARGGVATGLAVVGEMGPELADFRPRAQIYSASQTKDLLAAPAADPGLVHVLDRLERRLANLQARVSGPDILSYVDRRLSR